MRHAVGPAENVENNSFAVTGLLKICSHCERLSKKVREIKEKMYCTSSTASFCCCFVRKLSLIIDVLRRRVVFIAFEQTSCSAVFCPGLFTSQRSLCLLIDSEVFISPFFIHIKDEDGLSDMFLRAGDVLSPVSFVNNAHFTLIHSST